MKTRAILGTAVLAAALGAILACAPWSAAWAQTTGSQGTSPGGPTTSPYLSGTYRVEAKDESVTQRPREEFGPLGIELDRLFGAVGLLSKETVEGKTSALASFVVMPRVNTIGRWESNIMRSEESRVVDRIAIFSPGLRVQSDWDNHYLRFDTWVDFGRWDRTSTEDYDDFHSEVENRLDISDVLPLISSLKIEHLHEARGGIDDPGAGVRPPTYWQARLNSQAEYKADAILLLPRIGLDRTDYDRPEPIGQTRNVVGTTFRDRTDYHLGTRVGYEFQPGTIAFVNPHVTWRRFDLKRDPDGFQQDSQVYAVLAGLTWDVSSVTFVDAGIGYLRQTFEETRFETVGAPTFILNTYWNATDLLSFSLRGSRFTTDTVQVGVSSVLVTTGTFTADYEMLDNLIVSASATFTENEFEQQTPPRKDEIFGTRIGLTYYIGHHVVTGLGLGYETRESNTFGNSYHNRSAEIRFGLRM